MTMLKWNEGASTGELVAGAQTLLDDLNLDAVRRWKAEHPGRLAVGYMPVYAPRPLFEAIGALPVAVFGGGDQVDIIRGDSYFQSYICHIPRSTLELALGGQLDCLDGMVFPSLCDVIRNLGGMWKILFPKRYSAYLDLPQNFDLAVGGRFYAGELRRIARELHGHGALPLDDDALKASIRVENQRRQVLEEVDALRRREPWRVPASELYTVVRAGTMMPAAEHILLLQDYLRAATTRPGRPVDNVRVVMVGSFCEQPPVDLIRTLEKAGCDIVDDDLQLGLRYIEGDIEESGDPVLALARAFLERGAATASRYIGNDQKGRALIERVKASGADGVVFSAASFCDPALLDQPMLENALNVAGIPHTSLKYAENTGQFQVIREQAGAFSDAVKLWGGATDDAVRTVQAC